MSPDAPVALTIPDPNAAPKPAIYVWAVVGLSIAMLVFVAVITALRPAADNATLIAYSSGVIGPVMLALLAAAVQQTHLAVNSRMSELVKEIKLALEQRNTANAQVARQEGADAERGRQVVPPPAGLKGTP
jgi:hypothetical protein